MSVVPNEGMRSFTGFPIELARVPWTEAESELFLNEYKTERNFHTAAQRTGTKNASECEAWYLFLCRLDLLVNAFKPEAQSGSQDALSQSGDQLSDPKSNDDEDGRAKKRQRKKATAVQRRYKCPAEDCPRAYGTEGALKFHFRSKHNELGDYAQQAPRGDYPTHHTTNTLMTECRTPPSSPGMQRVTPQLVPINLQSSNTTHYIQIPGLGLAAVDSNGNATSEDGTQTLDANATSQAIQLLFPLSGINGLDPVQLQYIYMQAPGPNGTVEELQGTVQAHVIQADQTAEATDQVPNQSEDSVNMTNV
eukprot:TRINITY_DN6029_c0_g2_i1.p1 TRINITY_DN6029_c0_g2~~TRINITY_DN6029_c0_g2_i1.p1  ORF type:complete len:307 (-),score=28.21 TRINITY_DN6029_c0_g2_i1:2-922(-)